jgi:hypothetical protein
VTRCVCVSNVMLPNGRGVALAGTEIELNPEQAAAMEREGHVKRVVSRSQPQPIVSEPASAAPTIAASRPTIFPAPMPEPEASLEEPPPEVTTKREKFQRPKR